MKSWLALGIGAPVIEAALWLYRLVRQRAYADVEGRHYQYKTNPIDILEVASGERWLRVSDVRRTVAALPDFRRLRAVCPDGTRAEGRGAATERIEARALAGLLRQAQDADTLRFLRWLERDVIFPADKKAGKAVRDAIVHSRTSDGRRG